MLKQTRVPKGVLEHILNPERTAASTIQVIGSFKHSQLVPPCPNNMCLSMPLRTKSEQLNTPPLAKQQLRASRSSVRIHGLLLLRKSSWSCVWRSLAWEEYTTAEGHFVDPIPGYRSRAKAGVKQQSLCCQTSLLVQLAGSKVRLFTSLNSEIQGRDLNPSPVRMNERTIKWER